MVHLIESDTRKAAFLREAVRITQTPATVHNERIESVAERIGAVDVVTARALAPMEKQLSLAYPLLSTGARGIFLKGQDVDSELTEAAKSWSIDASIQPSLTDPRGFDYHWLKFHRAPRQETADTEAAVIAAGAIAVTPLQFERTSELALSEMMAALAK